jgi:Holliday junction resolvasome RuvABC endonuclease subunit
MKILALDLSLTSTGYCHDGETGVITPKTTGAERLSDIQRKVASLALNFSINTVVMEGYSFASRHSQAHSIGELGGVIRLLLFEMGIPYVIIPPTCRAKFATGKGNASKNEVVSSISAKTGIVWSNPGGDDKCDAWILEEMAKTHLGTSSIDWPKINKDALKTIDWSPLELPRKD